MKHSWNLIVLVILIFFIFCKKETIENFVISKNRNVVSGRDSREYSVVSKFGNNETAAELMRKNNIFIISLLRYIRNKYLFKKHGTNKEQQFVSRVLSRYNPDMVFENWPKDGEDTSFVVNKGEKFGLCLRSKKTMEFHPADLLQFVTIHELTHMGTITYGHNKEFWSWMKFMLVQAKAAGLHTPVNYSEKPVMYCGLEVVSNPYFIDHDWNQH